MCDAREEGATFGYSYMRRGSQGMTSMRGWTRLTWHETGTWRKSETGAVSRRLIHGRYADKQQPNENERERVEPKVEALIADPPRQPEN